MTKNLILNMEHQMSAKVVLFFHLKTEEAMYNEKNITNKYLKRAQSKILNSQTNSWIYSYFENIIVNKLLE